MTTRSLIVAVGLVLGACGAEPDGGSPLELTVADGTRVAGWFEHEGSVVQFDSTSQDGRRAALRFEIDGAVIDAELDVDRRFHQDGLGTTLGEPELAALLALRDAIQAERPNLVRETLHGKFLARHADWLADAPAGHVLDEQEVFGDRVISETTNDDSEYTTCLVAGAWYTAYYDQGNGGTQWQWTRQANSGSCLGRCGAGCNWFDTDLMLDCFEHDTCVDHFGGSVFGDNANCGDEFNHAVNEYFVTYGAWCP